MVSKIKIIKKPQKFMCDYIAVNGHLPKNELPMRMRKMHKNTIYIRSNICKNNPKRMNRIIRHEKREMMFIEHGYSYKNAHKKAGY